MRFAFAPRRGRGTVEVASDGTRERNAAARKARIAERERELDAEKWLENLRRREAAFEDCRPAPMPAPPADGKCPRVSAWKTSCKSRACPVCGPSWARNQRTKIGHNLEHYGGKVATIAITGPGADRLPWDEEWCKHRRSSGGLRPHVHSGRRGCRVEQRALREWCSTLSLRWKWLRDAAQLATKRETGARVWIMERVWEPQKRGVPHLHLVVPYGTPEERSVADAFRRHLAELAPGNDFGRVQPRLQAISGEQAARYLANYLAGRTGKKNTIRENIADPRLPKTLLWETPVLSSVSTKPRMVRWRERYGLGLGTGITMRTLRRMRHLWACFKGICDYYPRWSGAEEAVVTAAVFRTVAPTRAGPLGDFAGALSYARALDARATREGGWTKEWNAETQRVEMPEELCRELTRIAFEATRPLEAVAA